MQQQKERKEISNLNVTLRATMILSVLIALLLIIIQPGCLAEQVDGNAEKSDGGQTEEEKNDEVVGDASSNANKGKRPRITLLGFEDILNLKRSDILGLGNEFPYNDDGDIPPRLKYDEIHADDMVEDSFFDPFAPDPSCVDDDNEDECWHPPDSTIEEEMVEVCDGDESSTASAGLDTLPWGYGGADPDDGIEEEEEGEQQEECSSSTDDTDGEHEDEKTQPAHSADKGAEANAQCEAPKKKYIDKHWGSDLDILQMRDRLRGRRGKYWDALQKEHELGDEANATETETSDSVETKKDDPPRPPVFLLPGLASTRLVSWKHKPCPQNPLLSDVKMLDYVWLNMNLLIQMATIDARCWSECMTLGKHQSDYDGSESEDHGCKLRPDEGLDSISSLAPGSISSNLFVGGTNTVYAWLIQWLADNLGYDVTSIVALPYDWRLSPDKMEGRDGFLTMTRKKIEAAVESNGRPGIMVAHSMGNSVFRFFLEWLRVQMREEAYNRYVEQAQHTLADARAGGGRGPFWRGRALYRGARTLIAGDGSAEKNSSDDSLLDELIEDVSAPGGSSAEGEYNDVEGGRQYPKLYDLAKVEGDAEWIDWQQKHIWTYVGLAAPLLGAPGPLRSVLSGENMGLPFTHEEARGLELSFGSTSTVNPISTKMGFCDGDDVDVRKTSKRRAKGKKQRANLACLEELVTGIESSKGKTDPWKDFPALRLLLKDRVDFDSVFPTIGVEREFCEEQEASPCKNRTMVDFGPKDVMSGRIFDEFARIWREDGDPLGVKLDQLSHAWWNTDVPNILESTPDRPHIKHVIMAYGTDVSTEVGYLYRKRDDLGGNSTAANSTSSGKRKKRREEFDGVPEMAEVIWEERHGKLVAESLISEPATFTETILRKKKPKRRPLKTDSDEAPSWLHHSGDGTIPYISLMWAHTWLLHATRAMRSLNMTTSLLEGERISNPNNALDAIKVSHRPKGGNEWLEGYGADPRSEEDSDQSNVDADTGTSNPHGTKYKPKMVRFQSRGKSRSTGMTYTTTVIEAIGVEHKETTRNYDILAAAFTDVLKFLHIEDQL